MALTSKWGHLGLHGNLTTLNRSQPHRQTRVIRPRRQHPEARESLRSRSRPPKQMSETNVLCMTLFFTAQLEVPPSSTLVRHTHPGTTPCSSSRLIMFCIQSGSFEVTETHPDARLRAVAMLSCTLFYLMLPGIGLPTLRQHMGVDEGALGILHLSTQAQISLPNKAEGCACHDPPPRRSRPRFPCARAKAGEAGFACLSGFGARSSRLWRASVLLKRFWYRSLSSRPVYLHLLNRLITRFIRGMRGSS